MKRTKSNTFFEKKHISSSTAVEKKSPRMAFTEEELELLSKAAYVPTPRKIVGMDHKTDVIFFEPTTDEATHTEIAPHSKANSL